MIEKTISKMMKLNAVSRLRHWKTDNAHHHKVFEDFLLQNMNNMDSLVESVIGNDYQLDFGRIEFSVDCTKYSLPDILEDLKDYRVHLKMLQNWLQEEKIPGASEYIQIIDNGIESVSKALYLLKLK